MIGALPPADPYQITDPEYIKTAGTFQAKLGLNNWASLSTMADQWAAVEDAIRQDQDRAIKRMLRIREEEGWEEIPQWRLAQDRRFGTLLHKVDQEISSYVARSQGEIQRNGREAAELGRAAADALIQDVARGTRYQGDGRGRLFGP